MIAVWTEPFWPLVVTSVLLASSLVLPRVRGHWPGWVRVLGQLALFAALTVLVHVILGSPLEPLFSRTSPGERFWQQLIEASWWIIAARLASGAVRLFIVLESRPRETRFVSDLLVGLIAIATVLAIINFVLQVPVATLLATSGVIAIVLGLALQSTLSDVFSGIAVGIERPYEPGDAIWIEGGVEGRVVQVNWRSTHVATADHNIAVIPNSVMAKSRLINRSAPTPLRSATLQVALDAHARPELCREPLIAALRSCSLLVAEPAPSVSCTELRGDGMYWDIGFAVAEAEHLSAAKTEVLWQIHRHLRHAGIGLAVAGTTAVTAAPRPDLETLLRQSEMFGAMDEADRRSLAEHFEPVRFRTGDIVIRGNEPTEAMFLLTSGTAAVTLPEPGGARVVYRVNPGETLGAIGLVTGVTPRATTTAVTDVTAFRIDKAGLAAAMAKRPQLGSALDRIVAEAERGVHPETETARPPNPAKPDMLLQRVKAFLQALES